MHRQSREVGEPKNDRAINSSRRRYGEVAPGAAAGFIFQLERALEHLCEADGDAVVGVEVLDDVVVYEGKLVKLREQDKHSIRAKAELLGDRSEALWKTLAYWLESGESGETSTCGQRSRLIFATNNTPTSPLISSLAALARVGSQATPAVVAQLRQAGALPKARKRPAVQDVIDEVLAYDDQKLSSLLIRIEVCSDTAPNPRRRKHIATRFGITKRVDSELVLEGLFGWLTKRLMDQWRSGQPGLVARQECVEQCRAIERRLERQRILPLPEENVDVSESVKLAAQGRQFVRHLSLIEFDFDEIAEAIEDWARFNTEKSRLIVEGQIPLSEWPDRSARLKRRWRQISRQVRRERTSITSIELGQIIAATTTGQHCEMLDGEPCPQQYMTAGNYHRLADDNEVWWHPDCEPKDRGGQ
nr:ABC-three component system protein [Methylorubrum zatmanii]